MKIVIQLVLWAVIVFLGYLVVKSIYGPVEFNKIKNKRYAKVIENLKDIRNAELAHKEVTGVFEKDFDKLVRFIDTAQFAVTQRRDTTYLDLEYKKTYGVDQYIDDVVIDTLSFVSVKDSLFGNTDRYKTMMNIPIEGVNKRFDLNAGFVTKNDIKIPVFEAKVAKNDILSDLDRDLLLQENEVVSVEGVNGRYIKVGSMTEVNTNGNWPKTYGSNDQ